MTEFKMPEAWHNLDEFADTKTLREKKIITEACVQWKEALEQLAELRKEHSFYKKFYDFSTSRPNDASHLTESFRATPYKPYIN